MKQRDIIFLLLGMEIAFICTCLALYTNNSRWEIAMFNHHAAVWKIDMMTGKKSWSWLDDYLQENEQQNQPRKSETPDTVRF